jgi:hypothetical protein
MQDALNWISFITGMSAIIVVIWRFVFKRGVDSQEKKELKDKVDLIEKNLEKLSQKVDDVNKCANATATKIEPFWGLIMSNLPNLLNVSHSENLVAKLTDGRISDEELIHLEQEVQIMLAEDKKNGGKVFVDLMALWIIQVKKTERKGGKVSAPACDTGVLPNGGA